MVTRVTHKDVRLDEYLQSGTLSDTREYLDWKTLKILQGLGQSKDRATMIPLAKVWESLDIEH